jgi:hypothetical protein
VERAAPTLAETLTPTVAETTAATAEPVVVTVAPTSAPTAAEAGKTAWAYTTISIVLCSTHCVHCICRVRGIQ